MCAGLAVTLARSCVAGHANEVARGEGLLQDLVVWYEKALGRATRHVLGALALAGDHGATLEQVSAITGLDRVTVSDFIGRMAQGGTIDEVRDSTEQRMRVQPEALRYALVRDVFFGGPGSLNAESATKCLGHPSIAALPMIGAIHRGARVPPNQVLDIVDWDDEGAVTAYSVLGAPEFQTAVERSPAHRVSIARAALEAGIDERRAIDLLMQRAVGDHRPEHNTPDHPLRVVGDHLAKGQTGIGGRMLAVDAAKAWLDRGGDSDVGARVLMHAVQPEIRGSSLDAGLGDTLSIWEGAVPKSAVGDLSELWDEVLDFVESHNQVPPAPLLEGLWAWLHPDTIGFGRGPDEETSEAIRDVGAHVAERLSRIYADRPGVLSRLQAAVGRDGLDLHVDVPDEFATLFPRHWAGSGQIGGHEAWRRHTDERVRSLAEGWARRASADIATFIADVEEEARAAGIGYPRLTPVFAQALAANMDEPEELLAALGERNAPSDLLLPFIERAAELDRPGWEELVEQQLADPDHSGVAVRVALVHPCEKRLKRLAIDEAAQWPSVVEELLIRDEVDHATLALLFDAPDQSVRSAAAVTLWTFTGGQRLTSLPTPLQEQWRQCVVGSPGDAMLFAEVLKSDDDLCADWLRALFERATDPSHYEYLPPDVAEAITGLPVEVRTALVEDIPEGASRWMLREVVECLVSDDPDVMAALFARKDITSLHSAALHGGPSEGWMERALLALDQGWEPERVASSLRVFSATWAGSETTIWDGKIKDLERLRAAGDASDAERRERIIAAGLNVLEQMRDHVAERERRRRVFGDLV